MNMIHLVRKSIFSISLIERNSVCFGGHDGKTVLFQNLCHIFQATAFRYFDHHINNILCPYPFNRCASDMADSMNGTACKQILQQNFNLFVVICPLISMLDKKDRKQLP